MFKNLFFVLTFLLVASIVKSEGKDHILYDHNFFHSFALSGSGTLDIVPILDLDTCAATGVVDLNFELGPDDIITWSDGSQELIRTDITAGDYAVDLTVDGCDTTIYFNFDFPDKLIANVTDFDNQNCIQGDLGTISVGANGGKTPYVYSIESPIFQSSNIFNNLEADDYTITILDANGCTTQVEQRLRCVGCKISGNPVRTGDEFFVDAFFGDTSETAELKIYNTNGRCVLGPIEVPVVNGEIDSFPVTADLDPGMYVVLIVGESLSFSKQLIVIE